MTYQNNEEGLVQLLQEVEYVPGTFPPVYRLGGVLIGYDKLEKLRVLAAANKKSAQTKNRQVRLLRRRSKQLSKKKFPD